MPSPELADSDNVKEFSTTDAASATPPSGLAFDPAIVDGWFYGRGGADMKAGHAAIFAALDALTRIGMQPAAMMLVTNMRRSRIPRMNSMVT